MLMKYQISAHVHPPKGHGLRDGPLHSSTSGRHRKALGSAPERRRGIVVVVTGIGVDIASDVDGVGRWAKSDHLRIETNRDVQAILARQEEESVAFGAEFVSSLDRVNPVDLCL